MSQASRTIIESIVCQSSTIYERKQFPFIPITSNAESLIQSRLESWRKAINEDGKSAELEKYFQWQGIDTQTAARMVSPVQLEKEAPLPAWTQVLEEVLGVIEDKEFWKKRAPSLLAFAYHQDNPAKDGKPIYPLPFDALFTPFLEVIDRRLSTAVGYELLSLSAQQSILYVILKELAATGADVLYNEFNNFREKQPFGALIVLVAKAKQDTPNTTYQQFMLRMQQGGLIALLKKYAVLARLLCQLSITWMNTQREFLLHLAEDLADIQQSFQDGKECGKVSALTLSLSDRHGGGYSVAALSFESGLKLVYKHKDLRIEATYNQFLQWLNEQGSPVYFYPLKTLVRNAYGWVAFGEHQACRDQAAVQRFYQRMGGLLCLVYALEGTDCHEENIIACGEYPLMIDAETLFHHRVKEETTDEIRESAAFEASQLLSNSVLRVGLLPGWRMGRDRKVVYDASGLGGLGEQNVHFQRKRYTHINTDALEIVSELGVKPADKNVPFFEDGSPFHFEEGLDIYIDALVDGFEQIYRFLMHKRADLSDPEGILAAFQDKQIRFVFRATQIYFTLSQQARQIRNLQDGADYSLYLERLARAHLQVEDKPSCFPLLNAEREALTDLDIPFFTASTSSVNIDLMVNKRKWVVEKYFLAPSTLLVMQRLQNLTEEDLFAQLQIIRSSMYSRFAHQKENQQKQTSQADDGDDIDRHTVLPPPLQPETALTQALALSRRLLSLKIDGSDGSLSWFGIQLMPESGRYQYSVLGLSTYDGVAGIGIFLAALEKVLQLPEYQCEPYPSFRKEALASILPVRQSLKEKDSRNFIKTPLGGASGIGSSLYALLRIGKFLDEAALIEEALEAVGRITPEMVEKDTALDIISGSAGFILSLLALYKETNNPLALECALTSGNHLLTKRSQTEQGYRVWKTAADVTLSGFSHGTAGFAQALLCLYQHTHEKAFLEAAEEAIAYENTLFSQQRQNWRDLRDGKTDDYMVAWCHGAAGIGLQRASSLDILDTAQIRQDIESAILTTQKKLSTLTNLADHLCCGNLGRIEAIFSMGRQLKRPDLIQYALQAASLVVGNAAEKGGYQYASFLPRSMFAASFFQGGSGIGYELLRLTHPDILPNVLIWE